MNNSRNLMFLCDYQAPYGGNFIPSLMALEAALEGYGVCIVYVFPEEAKKRDWYTYLEKMGRTVTTFSKNRSKWKLLRDIQRLLHNYHISILHSHFFSIPIIEAVSFRNPAIKVVAHIHSDFSAGKRSLKLAIRQFCTYRLFSGKVHFLSVSQEFTVQNQKKIEWIPNALATERIPCVHTGAEEIRKRNNVKEDDCLIEIFAWSPYVKGLDIAVNAIKQLNEEGYPAKLAIVCGRQLTPLKMREWVKENTLCEGSETYLIYMEPVEDVFSYHTAADLLISASRSEGFSYAVLEMLSIGKRCVVSDIPSLSWAKEYDQTVYFESENQESCVSAIKRSFDRMRADPKTAEEIQKKYCINNWTEAVIRAYGIEK